MLGIVVRCTQRLVCPLQLINSSEVGMAFHGASSVEHKRFTQHNFKALLNTVKSVIFRAPSSLHFIIADFFYFRLLIFPNELEKFVDLFRKAIWSVKHAANKREFRQCKCFDYINFAIFIFWQDLKCLFQPN